MKVRHLPPALASVLALVMMSFGTSALAAEDPAPQPAAGHIATSWIIWVKDGQSRQFEDAIKAYAAWRKNAGESFKWSIYEPVVGSDLNHYVIRSGMHQWKDFDANAAWSSQKQAGAEFDKQVGPFVKRVEHYFSEDDAEHSHWIDSKDYKYFGVSHYQFKPGTRATVKGVMDKVQKAVVGAKWPFSYSISEVIGGSGGTNIVSPMKSYAEMADPEPSLMDILTKSLGSKEKAMAAMNSFSTAIEDHSYTVYAYRADLSTP
ncbi:MAG TPA: hypothetical protein VIL60_10240 [Rhodanobacter sp.]